MSTNPIGNFSQEKIKRFAESEDGKKLLSMLIKNDDGRLQSAVKYASDGNFDAAKKILEDIMKNTNKGAPYGK